MGRSLWRGLFGWARGGAEAQRFGGYQTLRLVHEGEKAFVYQARASADPGMYAVKLYKPEYNRTARRMRKRYHLRGEGEIGLWLSAPPREQGADFPVVKTVAHGFEFGDPVRCQFIVQEFVDGYNLKHMIACAHPLLREKRMDILRAAARGLAFIHDRGLVHRDVCTENILFSKEGRTKLIDLGFVAPEGIAFEEKSGTPSYMSPEQCQGKRLHAASDIYSFGVVLFETFTGRLPFVSAYDAANPRVGARRVSDLMQKHVHDAPPSPGGIAPDLPKGLERIILRCLEKTPERRYPILKELLGDLAEVEV